jgi:Zn-dependent protease/CBS domain-containing protein
MTTEDRKEEKGAAGSLHVATIAGIPVRIHFTFLLVLGYFAYIGQRTSSGWAMWVLFALAMFTCVVLHEFGHALTARKFGIRTRDITLYPIGGVAMFEGRMAPREELWIALAGPMVNVVISLLLGAFFALSGGFPPLGDDPLSNGLLPALLIANIGLAIFNLLPAFPMDGGRVLRSILARVTDEARATRIAGVIGQLMAVLFAMWGISQGNILFVVIALFVAIGANQEITATATRSVLTGHLLREAMQTRFRTITTGSSMAEAAEMLLAGSQHDFPVLVGTEVAGVLTRNDIARGLATEGPSAYVAAYMQRDPLIASPDLPLEEALELFGRENPTPILVLQDDQLVGMVTSENLSEFIMLQSALKASRR